MASITKRFRNKQGVKVLSGWDIQTTKISNGYAVFHCSASRYDESDAIKRREIIATIEKAFSKGNAAPSETIADIQALNDPNFIDWLIKYGVIKPVKVLSFDGLVEIALEGFKERGTKPQTLEYIGIGAAYFSNYLAEKEIDVSVSRIDKRIARDFWAWFRAKSDANQWSPATVNKYLGFIKQVFKWGVKNLDEMTANPFDCIDAIVDTREKAKNYLTEEQADQVLNALENSDKPELWTAFFLLGYRQGLRLWSEAPRLKWGFIDFEGRRLMIEDVKRSKQGGRKTREMILDDKTAEALRRLCDYRHANGETTKEQDFLFPEFTFKDSVSIQMHFKLLLQRLGIAFPCNVGTMRRAASNYWGELVGEYWENIFLGHSREVARTHYRTETVTRNAFDLYEKAKANQDALETF